MATVQSNQPSPIQTDRFLDELDSQESKSMRGNKGIKVCHGLNVVERFFAWLLGNTIEVWVEGAKEPYVLGRKSTEQFLLRHKDEAGIAAHKTNLSYEEISRGLMKYLSDKNVQESVKTAWTKKKYAAASIKDEMYSKFYDALIGKGIKVNNKDVFQVDTLHLLKQLNNVRVEMGDEASEMLKKDKISIPRDQAREISSSMILPPTIKDPLLQQIIQPAMQNGSKKSGSGKNGQNKNGQTLDQLPAAAQKEIQANAQKTFDDAAPASRDRPFSIRPEDIEKDETAQNARRKSSKSSKEDETMQAIRGHVEDQMANIRRSQAGSYVAAPAHVPTPKRPAATLDSGFVDAHKMNLKERTIAFSKKIKELDEAPQRPHHSFDAAEENDDGCKNMKAFVWTLFAAQDKSLRPKSVSKAESTAFKDAVQSDAMKERISKLKLMDQYFLLDIACSKNILPNKSPYNKENYQFFPKVKKLLSEALKESYQKGRGNPHTEAQCHELEQYLQENLRDADTKDAKDFYKEVMKDLGIKFINEE